jgi:hypothetical protein
VEAHLAACASCRGEVKSWEAVFGSLDGVERLAPSPGFAERGHGPGPDPRPSRFRCPGPFRRPHPYRWACWPTARLRGIPRVLGRGFALARRTFPQTRRGWAIAGGVASAPTITLVALLYLVFSRPLLTAGAFLAYASWKVSALLGSMASLLGTGCWLAPPSTASGALEALAVSPLLLGAGGFVFSLLCGIALWVLHRNLLVAPSNEGYAHVRL